MSWVEFAWWMNVLWQVADAEEPTERAVRPDRVPDRPAANGAPDGGDQRVVPTAGERRLFVERRAHRRDGCAPATSPECHSSGTPCLVVVP